MPENKRKEKKTKNRAEIENRQSAVRGQSRKAGHMSTMVVQVDFTQFGTVEPIE